MKIIITGAAGFLGSRLADRLLAAGNEVVGFDIAPPSEKAKLDKFKYIQGDLANEQDLVNLVGEENADCLVHLGGIMGGLCESGPLKAFDVNVRSTIILAEACLKYNVPEFVYASSISVFAPEQPINPVPDNGLIGPVGIYGATKASGEFLLEWYANNRGLDLRAIRLPAIWGAGRTRGKSASLSIWLDDLANGKEITVSGADVPKAWLYADDAVNAIIALINAEKPTMKTYNLNGELFTPRSFMTAAQSLLPGARIKYSRSSSGMNDYRPPEVYDDAKFRRDTGWTPVYAMEPAIKSCLEEMGHAV